MRRIIYRRKAVPQENASSYAASWLSAFDPEGLGGPFGLRTAEKRHPGYSCSAGCCSWAGHYWPFESSKAVTAAIHVLNHYADTVDTLDKRKFWHLLWQYTASHTPAWGVMNGVGNNGRKGTACYANLTAASQTARWLEPGLGLGDYWVAENGCADATIPTDAGSIPGPAWTDDATLGYRYNHASFMDLVLSGVVGLVPSANGTLVVNPLASRTKRTQNGHSSPAGAASIGPSVFNRRTTTTHSSVRSHQIVSL
jgi:hypothetical protein